MTAYELKDAPGEFAPLVARDVERNAGEVRSEAVVPWQGFNKGAIAVVLGGILVCGMMFLPQYDVMGKTEEREKVAEVEKELEKQKEEAKKQEVKLTKAKVKQTLSPQTLAKLQELKHSLEQMRPDDKEANHAKLEAHRMELDNAWKEIRAKHIKRKSSGGQFIGKIDRKLAEAMKEMDEGNSKKIEKMMGDLAAKAGKVAEMDEGLEKEKLKAELKDGLKQVLGAMKKGGTNTSQLQKAIAMAMSQMNQSNKPGMNKKAMGALQKQLGVVKRLAQQNAQSSRDMKSLSKAMKAIAMAKAVNKQGGLNGQKMANKAGQKGGGQKQGGSQAKAGQGKGKGQGQGQGKGQGNGQSTQAKGGKQGTGGGAG